VCEVIYGSHGGGGRESDCSCIATEVAHRILNKQQLAFRGLLDSLEGSARVIRLVQEK